MMTVNPYTTLAESVPSVVIQGFVLIMLALIFFGTVIQMIHHKNITYFFNNAKKAKLSAERELGTGHKAAIIAKTVVHDIATTAELGIGKRRVAHVLGMWGTILFWVASVVMIFCYSSADAITPDIWPMMWHVGAIMTCVGGYWFWFVQRVDVRAEGNGWSRIVFADLFVLSLVATSTFGLLWSFFQASNSIGLATLFFVLFVISNVVLFGGVYWSKFAHMFYKPGAAIQKHLAEEDGSRDDLPEPADLPKQYGLGIKRSEPQNY